MNAQIDEIRVCRHQDALRFHVQGRATMLGATAMRLCVEAQDKTSPDQEVAVDLRACTYMDSTFLGTLLHLNRREQGSIHLVSPSPECKKLLDRMGMTQILPIRESEEPAEADWIVISCPQSDVSTWKENVVDAHEELAHLPGPVGAEFQRVVAVLAADPHLQRNRPLASEPNPNASP